MAFSLENVRGTRAKNATDKAAEAAETPDLNNPDRVQATLDAMKASRLHKKIWEKGPTLPEILADQNQGPLFKEYLEKKHGVKLDSERAEGDLEKIANARVEFLERAQHVEQVRAMITPQMMQGIMDSGFINADASFKKLVNTVDAEGSAVFLDIIHKQLLPLAYQDSDRFDALAKSIETIAVQKTGDVEKRGRQAEAVLGKYKVKPTQFERIAERLANPDQTPEDQAATEEMVRAAVRSSHLLGWVMKGADKKADQLDARVKELMRDITKADTQIDERNQEYANFYHVGYLPVKARAEAHADDPAHESHAEEQQWDNFLRDYHTNTEAMKGERARMNKTAGQIQRWQPLLEKATSRGGARKVNQAIPNAEALLKEVDEQMQQLGSVLKLSFDKSDLLRKELGDAQKDANKQRPAPAAIDPEKIGERSAPAKEWRSAYTTSSERGYGRREGGRASRRNESGGGNSFGSWWKRNFPSLS